MSRLRFPFVVPLAAVASVALVFTTPVAAQGTVASDTSLSERVLRGAAKVRAWWFRDDIKAMARHLPADTIGVGYVQNMPEVAQQFGLLDDRGNLSPFLLGEMQREMGARDRAMFKKVLGFDPTTPDGFRQLGIDVVRPWGASVSFLDNDPEKFCVNIFVPAENPERLMNYLRSLAQNADEKLPEQNYNGRAVMTPERDFALTAIDDWSVAIISDKPGTQERCIHNIVDVKTKSLQDETWFKDSLSSFQQDWQGMVSIGGTALQTFFKELMREDDIAMFLEGNSTLQEIEKIQSMTYGFNINSQEMSAIFDVAYSEPIPMPNQKDAIVGKMPKDPWMLLRSAIDIPKTYNDMFAGSGKPADPQKLENIDATLERERQEFLAEIKTKTGVDFEKDIINQLSSPVGMFVAEDRTVGGINIGGSFWIPLAKGTDGAKFDQLFNGLMKEERISVRRDVRGSVTWNVASVEEGKEAISLGWSIIDGHLVLALGSGTIDHISQSMAGGANALDRIRPSDLKDSMVKDGYASMYVDLSLIGQFIKEEIGRQGPLSPDDKKIFSFLDELDTLVLKTTDSKNHYSGRMTLRTKHDGAMRKLISEFLAEEANEQPQYDVGPELDQYDGMSNEDILKQLEEQLKALENEQEPPTPPVQPPVG